MSRLLVTGAGGFIGSHVARAAQARGYAVRALLRPGETLQNLAGVDAEVVRADVRDAAAVAAAVQGCEQVVHLASIYAVWSREPTLLHDVNVGGTRNVLEAALAQGVKRVVVTTSQGVWAGTRRGTVITEDLEPNQGGCSDALGDAYCSSKLGKHRLVAEYAARGLDVVAAAPTMPWGPGDLGPTPTGQILLSMVDLPVFTFIETPVNLVDVRDCALGHLLALERGRRGETYLLGGRETVTMAALCAEVARQAGLKRLAVEVPYPLAMATARLLTLWADHVSHAPPLISPGALRAARAGFRVDCKKAIAELGFDPRPWPEAVAAALRWFAETGRLKSRRAVRHALGEGPPRGALS